MTSATCAPGDRRAQFERGLLGRFWLRFHMSVMLMAAFSAGTLTNFGLLRWPLHSVLVRWVIAYLVGYAVLFLAMRVWLAYIGVRPLWSVQRSNCVNAGDVIPNGGVGGGVGGGGGGGGVKAPDFRGGGGSFGGGGSSASFDEDGARALVATSAGGSPSSAKGTGGIDLGDIGDGGVKVLVLIAIVVALAVALGGGVVYLILAAPHLLADIAVGAALTGGIAPSAKRAAAPEAWEMSVWRATWKPFIVMLVVVIAAAIALQHYFPGAMTLAQAWMRLRLR